MMSLWWKKNISKFRSGILEIELEIKQTVLKGIKIVGMLEGAWGCLMMLEDTWICLKILKNGKVAITWS